MRFLFVGSHLCARASFRPPLAGLPLPSASSYMCPTIGHYRYSYRGLSPHKFMPMSGVHKALKPTVSPPAGRRLRFGVGREARTVTHRDTFERWTSTEGTGDVTFVPMSLLTSPVPDRRSWQIRHRSPLSRRCIRRCPFSLRGWALACCAWFGRRTAGSSVGCIPRYACGRRSSDCVGVALERRGIA